MATLSLAVVATYPIALTAVPLRIFRNSSGDVDTGTVLRVSWLALRGVSARRGLSRAIVSTKSISCVTDCVTS